MTLLKTKMRSTNILIVCLVICVIIGFVEAVDRKKFRTCKDTAFCRRLRDQTNNQYQYTIDHSTVSINQSTHQLNVQLTNQIWPLQPRLSGKVQILADGLVHLQIQETQPLHPRWIVRDVIEPSAQQSIDQPIKWSIDDKQAHATYQIAHTDIAGNKSVNNCDLLVTFSPFTINLSINGHSIVQFNGQSTLAYEQYRERNPRPEIETTPASEGVNAVTEPAPDADPKTAMYAYDSDDMWSESTGGHTDNKARGPSAIGGDITFPGSKHIYGLPEHAADFTLKSTKGAQANDFNEPYRLFNLDVFEYELNEPMALYGAVPFVVSHTADATAGVLWLNSAETYVDVYDTTEGGSLLSSGTPNKNVHWMSESGVVDVYMLPGPTPAAVFSQYARLTGAPQLPPYFSIAYHQCRWNYKSEDDVAAVDAGFDEYDIPYDVLWLDIEHTDGKKYFTWDSRNFPHPEEMQRALAAKGRNMVTIVDPHMKRDTNYDIHNKALELDLYVKTSGGSVYEGWCWPGSVSYLDFLEPKVREFWADQFALDKYPHSTPSLFVWNDMNEPSVFNGPEVTMPKDCKHLGSSVEHRDVHNLYGFYNHMATSMGLKKRDNARPFVLTRSFFSGSQKYSAVWTGDNTADWGHLAASTPMLLSLNVAGIVFSGADVGGFFKDPDAELLTRWYQVAAFQPFFRGHAHIDTKRREPWLMGAPYTKHIQTAIRTRYAHLPYLYTVFFQSHIAGLPIARPLWMEFPTEATHFAEEQHFMLGSSILIVPVTQAAASSVTVKLPSGVWYDMHSHAQKTGATEFSQAVTMDSIPVYYRGGSIVARKDRARRSSSLMKKDPFTLIVSLDSNGKASGSLYLDDGRSYDYMNGAFAYRHFSFDGSKLTASQGDLSAFSKAQQNYVDSATIERIVLLGFKPTATQAIVKSANAETTVSVVRGADGSTTIRKPDAPITGDFTIVLQ